ncbi:SSI family serine proteinase inhibitor [Nocardia sp. 2YAB30]|uniref:SSI family serine proteinase inhibitor n=1 Tax=unclassified Nocardia TaxID=2637762 RepID=UPI003F99A984
MLFAAGIASAAPSQPEFEDSLTVTVDHSGVFDGMHELKCHPTGGTHPDSSAACARLDELAAEMHAQMHSGEPAKNPFTPVPPAATCTQLDGGPATAHVVGTWLGQPLDTTFTRTDGCQIDRWERLVPVLPRVAQQ